MLRNCLKWEFEGNVLQRVGLFFYLLLFFSPMNNNFGHCMANLPGTNQGEVDSAGQNEAEGIKGKEEIICFSSAGFLSSIAGYSG